MIFGETICAPSTPPINSAIAIIRVCGPQSLSIAEKIFTKKEDITPRYAHYGSIADLHEIIDDVILIYYRSPMSYTGEDMIEIFCHGNQLIVGRILKLLHTHGIRLAEPGEFSKIAFLNGKMDLTEAEALNQLIIAKSDWELHTALNQMHGSLRNTISRIKNAIVEFKADIEAGIDFIEEDIEFISSHDALMKSEEIEHFIDDVLRKCKIGEKLSHGIDITITGKPNVGKSSVLNLLLNNERAIVSDIPGTTRDMIREPIQIGGIQFNLIDTAGIDTPKNKIEKIGIETSCRHIETSPIILMIIDATTGIQNSDERILEMVRNKNCIYLINKIDIAEEETISDIESLFMKNSLRFSAKTGAGLKELEKMIVAFLQETFGESENTYVADMRIIHLFEKSLAVIIRVKDLIKNQESSEIIAFELQELIETLSEITGEITPDDILHSVFSRFCIGK